MVGRAPEPAPRGRDESAAPTPERVAQFFKLVRAWFWADRQRREAEDPKADRRPPHVERLLAPYKVNGGGGETQEQWVARLLATTSAECGAARELVAFGRQLALDLEQHGLDSRPVLLVVQAADGGGGVATLAGTWPATRVEIERIRLRLQVAASTKCSSARASHGGGGFVATGGVSSPPPPSDQASAEPAEPLMETSRSDGDETDARKPASEAGLVGVSSPVLPAKALVAGEPPSPDSVGGDGTETSQAAPHSELAVVPSPAAPVAGAVPSTTRGAVRLFAFKESLESPFGAPRESGRVTANLVREGQPPELVQISRAQYDSLVDLARKRALAFSPSETGQRARNRLRKRLDSWGVRTSVPARAAGAGQAHVLRLEWQFTVHLADGSPDRTAAARRLVREANRQRLLGQD